MVKYIIEHLEERVYPWCILEYESISKAVGKGSLIITNVKSAASRKKLANFASEVRAESVNSMGLAGACLLDMDAEKELSPDDKFGFLIFGGILGDYPPRKRTVKFLGSLKAEKRHLGKVQMPTDNAVLAAKMVVDGKNLSEIKFIDCPSIPMEEGLELELPYRFVDVNGKPFISSALVEHIKKSGF